MASWEPGDQFNAPPAPGPAVARLLNVLLGVWLFISAFLWSHDTGQLVSSLIFGVLLVLAALAAFGVPALRWLVTIFAMALFIVTAALGPTHVATQWNNALVAIASFVIAFVPGNARGELRRSHEPRTA